MKRFASIPPLAVVLSLVSTASASSLAVIDQQNLINDARSFSGQSSIGQSFVPSLPAIEAIEFELGALTGGNHIFVNLRDGVFGATGLEGPILGRTNTLTIPSDAELAMRHFDFENRIALTPGNTYVAEVVGDNGQYVGLSFNDRYPPGESFKITSPGWDLVFVEGLHVPEPGTAILAAAAAMLASLACGRRRRAR
jgi:hypothetical protein